MDIALALIIFMKRSSQYLNESLYATEYPLVTKIFLGVFSIPNLRLILYFSSILSLLHLNLLTHRVLGKDISPKFIILINQNEPNWIQNWFLTLIRAILYQSNGNRAMINGKDMFMKWWMIQRYFGMSSQCFTITEIRPSLRLLILNVNLNGNAYRVWVAQ